MLLLQIIRCVHTCNFDNASAVRATSQKLHGCYLGNLMQACAVTLYFFD
jgi:hypothetical protein